MIRTTPSFQDPPGAGCYLDPTCDAGWSTTPPPAGLVRAPLSRLQVTDGPDDDAQWLWPAGEWRRYVHEHEAEFFQDFSDWLRYYLYEQRWERRPFQPAFTYEEFWREVLSLANGDLDLVARWLEREVPFEVPYDTRVQAVHEPGDERDEWTGVKALSRKTKQHLARTQAPFHVHAVRRVRGTWNAEGRFEKGLEVWELLISGPSTGRGRLSFGTGIATRDRQMEWLARRDLQVEPFGLALVETVLRNGRTMYSLTRAEVVVPQIRR